MRRHTSTSRLTAFVRPTQRAVTHILTIGLMCLAACGSDDKKTTPAPGGNGNTTTGPSPEVVNSDKESTDPTTAPLSSAFRATSGATVVEMPYVLFSQNPNAANPARAYSIAGNTYDTCTFGFRHGYSKFPTGKFSFVGFFLVNGTPGAAIAPGVYTAGQTTGMYIDVEQSGAGYSLTGCKAASYAAVESGTITVTEVGKGTGGTKGSVNVTMKDGSVVTGDFGTGACVGGTSAAIVQPTSDPYACTKLN